MGGAALQSTRSVHVCMAKRGEDMRSMRHDANGDGRARVTRQRSKRGCDLECTP